MENIISKELLSEIFTDGQQDFIVDDLINNTLRYKWVQEELIGDGDVNCKLVDMEINIHELAHKCKEWAFDNMFLLSSGYDIQGGWCIDRVSNTSFVSDDEPYTEPEAIFKACQWILENKDK